MMLERGLRVIAVAALLVAASACGKTIDAPAGTNTNWLGSCQDDGDCRNGNECICGVCTQFCSNDGQCGALDDDAFCTNRAECGGGADDELAGQAACLLGCNGDDDCSAIENGECRGGACLPRIASGSAGSGSPPRAGSGSPPSPGNPDGGPGVDDYALRRNDREVEIGAAYLNCAVDEDCTLVATGCDGCCQWGAIDADLKDTYEENFDRACADYRGPECDCQPQPTVATCVAGTCTSVEACFSPTQHSQRANDIGAIGCPCDMREDSICIGRVGLVCAQSFVGSGSVWTPVEDGPCDWNPDMCVPAAIREDATACLAAYNTCRELPSGQFCGEGCTQPFDCTRVVCEAYAPIDNPDCTQLASLVEEGLCDEGKLRYRVDSSFYTGTIRYWNASTGDIVAARAFADMPAFCDNTSLDVDYGDHAAIVRCTADEQSRERICPKP